MPDNPDAHNEAHAASEIQRVDVVAIEAMRRAEIDIQIATARAYPRNIKTFLDRAQTLATISRETAEACFYAVPRTDQNGRRILIEGPSVRLAEIVAATYGNFRAQADVVDIGARFVRSQGIAHDLESNVAISVSVQRRITGRNERRYSDDMIMTTCNAACAIALRNAVFRVIPGAITAPILSAVKEFTVGDSATIGERRSKLLAAFQKMNPHITEQMVCSLLNELDNARVRQCLEDITGSDLQKMAAVYQGIRDGESSIDDLFPELSRKASPAAGGKTGTAAALADKAKAKAAEGKPAADAKTEPTMTFDPPERGSGKA